MREICDTCQHNVNRFSAITAHCGSSRFVTGLLSSKSADFTGRVSDIMEMIGLKISLQYHFHILCSGQDVVGVTCTSKNFINHGIVKGTLGNRHLTLNTSQKMSIQNYSCIFVAPKIKEVYINFDLLAITQSKVKQLSSYPHLVYIIFSTPSQIFWVQASPANYVFA